MKKLLLIPIILGLIATALFTNSMTSIVKNYRDITTTHYSIPANIDKLATDVGIDKDILSKYAIRYSAYKCTGQIACFTENTLYVSPSVLSMPYEKQKQIIAHEYLHEIYQDKKTYNDQTIYSELNDVYNVNTKLQQRMSVYKLDQILLTNELHSVECTEVKQLPAELEQHCNQYVNRSSLNLYL